MQTNNNETLELTIYYASMNVEGNSERTNPNLLQIYRARLVVDGEDCGCIDCGIMEAWVMHLTNEPTHRRCNWCGWCMDCEGVIDDQCSCDDEANNNPDCECGLNLCGECNQQYPENQ